MEMVYAIWCKGHRAILLYPALLCKAPRKVHLWTLSLNGKERDPAALLPNSPRLQRWSP